MESGVYLIRIGGKKAYIGGSSNLAEREKIHLRELRRKAHQNPYLQELYNQYGTFDFEILEKCDNYFERERYWVEKAGIENLANEVIPNGTSGTPSRRMNEKRSKKLKEYYKTHEANKGMLGRHHSEETKKKMRENHSPNSPRFQKGHSVSVEVREKISKKNKERWRERKSRI